MVWFEAPPGSRGPAAPVAVYARVAVVEHRITIQLYRYYYY